MSTEHKSNDNFPAKDSGFRDHMQRKQNVFHEHSPEHPDYDVKFDFPIDDVALLHLASSNPTAAVMFFKTLFEAFIECVLGVPSQQRPDTVPLHHPSRRGVYDIVVNIDIVNECNGRGSLHFHTPIIGVFNPSLLQKLVHSPKFMAALRSVYDSMIQAPAFLPMHLHAENMIKVDNCLRTNTVNYAAVPVPLPCKNANQEQRDAWRQSLQHRSE
jgi:hypothetical protein